MTFRVLSILAVVPVAVSAQISNLAIEPTATQAIIRYTSPVAQACSLKIADMYRSVAIASASQTSGTVTVTTVSLHGLLAGAVIYIENTGQWDGWQTISTAPSANAFTFASTTGGSVTSGNVGVLVDDVNPVLFPGADQDSRNPNVNSGPNRVFVAGTRAAPVAADGNRYSRALQNNARHHVTITCGAQSFDAQFTTLTVPTGDTHNEGLPADRNSPGQYAYPGIQWGNQMQSMIDPLSGVRSFRATAPTSTASGAQAFQTALDVNSVWQNKSGPLKSGGGAASYTGGSCGTPPCPLFLRADNLSVAGGATYTVDGSSLNWVQATVGNAAINNGSCSGDDCKVQLCLTVNGVTCTSGTQEIALTTTPSSYTIGTQNPMDLWQSGGPPQISRVDVSQATGTVNYTAATSTATWTGGNFFNIKWTPGSRITIAGSEYSIASVQSEQQITLAAGPAGNLSGVPFSGNNFGVLIWKKTATRDQVSIGNTTYQYGSSSNPSWNSYSVNACGPIVTVNGVPGYNCFVSQELYWVAQDGSDLRDLGWVQTNYFHPPQGTFGGSIGCGSGTTPDQFDPADGDTWYCLLNVNQDPNLLSVIKVQYTGLHQRVTPGAAIADCAVNGNTAPCLNWTVMQPNQNYTIAQSTAAFSPAYQASPFQAVYWEWVGISPDGELLLTTRTATGQDSPGWLVVYTLGDRTPAGTGANSIRPIGVASSFLTPPLSYCVIHSATGRPQGGWAEVGLNDMSHGGPTWVYQTTIVGGSLSATSGVPGGLNACPANPLGVTGQSCSNITISGDPTRSLDGTSLRSIQVGDVMQIDTEYMRVVAKASATNITVQRGYAPGPYSSGPANHSGTTLAMHCGAVNPLSLQVGYWDYRDDPFGTNANWTTISNDQTEPGTHNGYGSGVAINGPDGYWDLGQTLCPSTIGTCYSIRLGASWPALATAPIQTVAGNAAFGGVGGIGNPNNVDSHPGPCLASWCLDARPMFGGMGVNPSNASTYTNVAGQLWKATAAQTAGLLNRKFLTTMAYSGRFPLVDVSGPGSTLGNGAADSFKYCYVLAAGECVSGSNAGELYVNSPFVSSPYCYYPGIALPADDVNSICIGDLGALTGNIVQVGAAQQDLMGTSNRRLGPLYERWNQFYVYWNVESTPNGQLMFSNARWLDGVRHEDLVSILPPYGGAGSLARNTFVGTPVKLTPPVNRGIDNAIIEFGYAENGDPNSFFCTSRQESCVATANAIGASPFFFEQTEQYKGQVCSSTCVVMVPALSQHILYYRWKYRDKSGNTLLTSSTNVIAVP